MKKKTKIVIAPKESIVLLVEDGVLKSESYEAIRDQVCAALQNQVRVEQNSYDAYSWIQNLYSDKVVYALGGEYYQRSYTITGDTVTFGDAVEVEMSWTPVGESQRALVGEVAQVKEAAYDASKGELTVKIIQPGFSKNQTKGRQRYYPAETIRKSHKIFEGAKMFGDHQTDKEAKEKPEGSVHNWVANLGETWVEEADGAAYGKATVIDPAFKAKLENLKSAGLLSEMGVSIRCAAECSEGKVEGRDAMVIESLLSARSVDFVTYAGAGGRVETLESDESEDHLDLISETRLREKRPDLVELIESKFQSEDIVNKTLEQQLQEANTQLAAANTQLATEKKRADTSEAKVQEAEKTAKKATAQVEIAKLINESKLPEKAQERLKKQFSEAIEVAGVAEAISFEKEYLKSVGSAAVVKNLGENAENKSEPKKISLKESFMNSGLNEKEAEIAAAGR